MEPPLQSLRKCSRENCPPMNVSSKLTRYCFDCKSPIHLLCYGITKSVKEIFITDNVTMVCDECLTNTNDKPSPKRKQPNAASNIIQSTIDVNASMMSLSKVAPTASTPSKSNTVNQQSNKLQSVIEALVQKVET